MSLQTFTKPLVHKPWKRIKDVKDVKFGVSKPSRVIWRRGEALSYCLRARRRPHKSVDFQHPAQYIKSIESISFRNMWRRRSWTRRRFFKIIKWKKKKRNKESNKSTVILNYVLSECCCCHSVHCAAPTKYGLQPAWMGSWIYQIPHESGT